MIGTENRSFFYFQREDEKNMAINKVIYGGKTLIDLTNDTATADKILSGFTAHDRGGSQSQVLVTMM